LKSNSSNASVLLYVFELVREIHTCFWMAEKRKTMLRSLTTNFHEILIDVENSYDKSVFLITWLVVVENNAKTKKVCFPILPIKALVVVHFQQMLVFSMAAVLTKTIIFSSICANILIF